MNNITVDQETRPASYQEPKHLNKLQITKKIRSSNNQEVDPNYKSDDEQEKTLDLGKDLVNVKDVRAIDICFLVDTTGSMKSFIGSIKELIRKIIKDGVNFLSANYSSTKDVLQVAVVAYRDHDDEKQKDSYLTQKVDFTDCNSAKSFVNRLNCKGGFDKAEAVMDGYNEVTQLKWRDNSQKYLIHFLDGPPHGNIYGGETRFPDGYNKCGLSDEDVLLNLRDLKNLKYSAIRFSNDVEKFLCEVLTVLPVEVLKLDPDYDYFDKKCQEY